MEEEAVVEQEQKETKSMYKYCPVCGAEVLKSSRVCTECGSSIVPIDETKKNESPLFGWISIILALVGGIGGLVMGIVGSFIMKRYINKKRCRIAIGISFVWIFIYLMIIIITAGN